MTATSGSDPISGISFPRLPAGYEPTRATLHAYARAVGAIPRAHGISHPKWWHVSLTVWPEGLVTDPVPLPGGGTVTVGMDLRRHQIVVHASDGDRRAHDMTAGMTGTELGDALIADVADHGLDGPFDRTRFASDAPRPYDRDAAAAFFAAFVNSALVFEYHRVRLGASVSPVQVWPHGFDLAFEWFGTRTVQYEGEEVHAQLNLGFVPGSEPYFYSNPWPFDDRLIDAPLPDGARWTTESFAGSVLPYDTVRSDPDPGARLLAYARAVHRAAAPTLARPPE